MEEIAFIGEDTRLVLPPAIPDLLDPAPVSHKPNPYGNSEDGLCNATFQLWSTANLPPNTNLVMQLHQKGDYKSAMITLEAHADADKSEVLARFWQDGTHPTNTKGLPLMHMGVIEIKGFQNVKKFRIISADNRSHTINIQYFG